MTATNPPRRKRCASEVFRVAGQEPHEEAKHHAQHVAEEEGPQAVRDEIDVHRHGAPQALGGLGRSGLEELNGGLDDADFAEHERSLATGTGLGAEVQVGQAGELAGELLEHLGILQRDLGGLETERTMKTSKGNGPSFGIPSRGHSRTRLAQCNNKLRELRKQETRTFARESGSCHEKPSRG